LRESGEAALRAVRVINSLTLTLSLRERELE
jgi:hypothetical protein